jgi:hypothetical protein
MSVGINLIDKEREKTKEKGNLNLYNIKTISSGEVVKEKTKKEKTITNNRKTIANDKYKLNVKM